MRLIAGGYGCGSPALSTDGMAWPFADGAALKRFETRWSEKSEHAVQHDGADHLVDPE